MDPKSNNIEIIELDCDDPKGAAMKTVVRKSANSKIISLPTKGNVSRSKTPDPNKITAYSPDTNKSFKTVALIPVDYLQYCDMKDGKFAVKLDTLNKLKTLEKKSSVYVYNVPQDGISQNVNETSKIHVVRGKTIDAENKLVTKTQPHFTIVKDLPTISNSSTPINKIKLSPKSIKTLNKSPISTDTKIISIPNKFSPISKPSLRVNPTKKKMFTISDDSLVSSIVQKHTVIRQIKNLNKVSSSKKFVIEKIEPKNSNKPPPSDCQKKIDKIKVKNLMTLKDTGKLINASIDLTDEPDPLDTPGAVTNSFSTSQDCLSPPPLVPINKNIKGPKVNLTPPAYKNGHFVSNSSTESGDESPRLDNLFGGVDLPNIFEPIITLDETGDKVNTIENTLTDGLRGDGIPDDKIQELESMIRSNAITSPVKVMIPTKFLKYCTKKDGKYCVDLNALRKINREKQESMSLGNEHSTTDSNIKVGKKILQRKSNEKKINQVKIPQKSENNRKIGEKNISTPRQALSKRRISETNVSEINQPQRKRAKSLCEGLARPNYPVFTINTSVPTSTYPAPDTNVQTFADKCRFLYMKSSVWDEVDPESKKCKGFNEREKAIVNTCLINFSKYLDEAKDDHLKLINSINVMKKITIAPVVLPKYYTIPKKPEIKSPYKFLEPYRDDLYFTKKIDILDTSGRKIRTEHIKPNNQNLYKIPKWKQNESITKKRYLASIQPCKIVIERNEVVEARIKAWQKREKLRAKLYANFIHKFRTFPKDSNKPLIILNEHNFHTIKLYDTICSRSNVIYVKKFEDAFPDNVDENFINLVDKKLIRIASPSAVKYFFK